MPRLKPVRFLNPQSQNPLPETLRNTLSILLQSSGRGSKAEGVGVWGRSPFRASGL